MEKMTYITWDFYEIWYHGRSCRILVPKDISQLWTVYYPGASVHMEPEVDFFGNRKGLEALRNACAALSKKDDIIVYFPCKKNNPSSMYNYFFRDQTEPKKHELFMDLVFMKPNSVKIKDWKEIRKRISKMKSRQWGYDFQYEFKDMHVKPKYEYRKERPKAIYRFDTVFFNAPDFEYPDFASELEGFLVPELEKNFYEDIKEGKYLRGEDFLWYKYMWEDFGIFFWDNDIYREVEKLVPKIKSIQEVSKDFLRKPQG